MFFDSLAGAAMKFGLIAAEYEVIKVAVLRHAAKDFLAKAQAAMGTYEYGWPPLADDTVARKTTGDSPGIETGAMKASGDYEVHLSEAIIGFKDPKIVWFEFGTSRQPPRPVIGGTIDHHGEDIAKSMGVQFGQVIGETLVAGRIAGALGKVFGGTL